MFKQAIKQEAKLRLAIAGTSGSGKTYTSLAIASGLGKKIAFVDTEHGSASKYADLFSFDVLEMQPPYHPDRFGEAIKFAQDNGYDVIVIDSLSHAWNGTGGLLELVDQFALRYKGNTFAGWKEGTPIYNRLIDNIIASNIHVIATMRSKQDYVLDVDSDGKQRPKKVGLAPIQREGFEYEFDIFMEMDIDNVARVIKTRCPELSGQVIKKPNVKVAETLIKWLSGEKKVESVDPLSDSAVKYASKEWNISPDEAREQIKEIMKTRTFNTKEEFKLFVTENK
jgi:hypothetical protein